MKITAEIQQQLPILVEFVRTMRPDFIPREVASASTILYAIQERMIDRSGKFFTVVPA